MDEEFEHNLELINIYTTRLRYLELQIARYGNEAPPHLQMEAEEIRLKLIDLNKNIDKIKLTQGSFEPQWLISNSEKPVKQLIVFGKTGVGKSSILSKLSGQQVPIGHVVATTRSVKSYDLSIGAKQFKVIDCPGIGGSIDLDEEYSILYQELLRIVDIILWVIHAEDRAISAEMHYFRGLLKPYVAGKRPLYVVLNKVDLIYPHDTWDSTLNSPSAEQMSNMSDKMSYVAGAFSLPRSRVIPVSAYKNYNIDKLREVILSAFQ